MSFTTLHDWLAWQETQHAKQIDLGLERTRPVLQRMGLERPPHTVITVAGTNGKGSSVAFLEAILRAAGYRVGAYSSPHLLRYNERVRLHGVEVSDAELCASFARIDAARAGTSLTYFEFGTLAAFDIFQRAQLDVAVLEVGLGGRLDTVNLLDADAALVTSVGIDHVEYLGPDRDSIGREKAGIFRAGRPAVCADPDPPRSLLAYAEALQAPLYRLGRDFDYHAHGATWAWWCRGASARRYEGLPRPALPGAFQLQNAAGALMALESLRGKLNISPAHIAQGLTSAALCGRFQIFPGPITRVVDVAHNPHGAAVLAATLREHPVAGRTFAVFAMLADKDIAGVAQAMRGAIDAWYVATLHAPRAAAAADIAQHLHALNSTVYQHADLNAAYRHAMADAQPGDRVVVFGSFYTVGEVLRENFSHDA